MSDFYKLHQRQDLVLCTHENSTFVGLVLGYFDGSYAIQPLYMSQGEPNRQVLSLFDKDIQQKVGTLDFDSLNGAEPAFEFGDWVEADDF